MQQSKILIIDDSTVVRTALRKLFERENAVIYEADNGLSGFDLAIQTRPDLIVSDVDMPNMDGLTLCDKLKHTPSTQGIPVVILSAEETEEDIERGFSVGASAYVTKSGAHQDLIPCIRHILAQSAVLRGRLVLIVDDSQVIRSTVHDGLIKEGFRVITAANGHEALKTLRSCAPDLILSDIDMPLVDGAALCEAVKSTTNGRIPFIIMGKAHDMPRLRRLMQKGASGFITKPFHVEQLVIMAEKLLSDHFRLLLAERRRLESEQEMMLGSIASLIQALEARDEYTRGHSESVARLSVLLGSSLGLNENELDRLNTAARLHDLGKIGIPDNILLKPGRLSDEEFNIIRRHPTLAADILAPIPILSDIIPAVISHHERLDGKGYPQGLKGESIPLWGRIIAVADVYHALRSDRPYRTALPQDQVLGILSDARGTHLCPDCLDAFLKVIENA